MVYIQIGLTFGLCLTFLCWWYLCFSKEWLSISTKEVWEVFLLFL